MADDLQTIEDEMFADGALHVSSPNIDYLRGRVASAYRIDPDNTNIWVVGSAKLGFATAEKRLRDGSTLPRYRPFGANSDIDLAVVSGSIFDEIWRALARHVNSKPWMPQRLRSLGDYLVYGWLRPDHFPSDARLAACDTWWDTFRSLSGDARFRRPVRGGLFYSEEHMKMYYQRSVRECQQVERASV